jgi:peptidoglycan/LPS O-acetylase OafA/YrhL
MYLWLFFFLSHKNEKTFQDISPINCNRKFHLGHYHINLSSYLYFEIRISVSGCSTQMAIPPLFFLGALVSLTSYSKKVYKGKVALPIILFLLSSTKPLYFAIFGAICLTFFTVNLGGSKIFSKISPRIDISYGIYLYHFPVEQTLAHFKYMREHLLFFILFLVFLTSTFALFSAKYIEAPFQRKAKVWILNHQ